MIIVGLTGSIGMGKSTTANMFRKFGIAVHDSDAAVHEIYRGSGASKIESLFPGIVIAGKVDRGLLAKQVFENAHALHQLEELVHPLVAQDRDRFVSRSRARGDRIVVLDIPLLFEVSATGMVDVTVVVSASEAVQRARVLARPGMTVERFRAILRKQTPDSVKRQWAHFIVDTGLGIDAAERQVNSVLKALSSTAMILRV